MPTNKVPSPHSFGNLFQDDTLRCIPMIYPGETLFSWCARYHRISGSISSVATSQRLFRSKTAGFVVDFPGKIEHLFQVTASFFCCPEQLINDHTLLPLYVAFRPQSTGDYVKRLMLGMSVEKVKFILGLPASRAATWHPLKFCLNCATEELNQNGIACWWREHQWPSVWICGRHQTNLFYQHPITLTTKLSRWLTPDELIGDPNYTKAQLQENLSSKLDRLRKLTSQIVESSQIFRPEILRIVFILRLHEHGWIKPGGKFDMSAIQEAFLTKFRFLESLPGFDFIQSIKMDEFGTLGPMLRGSKRSHHPSKYLLLIDFLFDNAEQFFHLYRLHASTEEPEMYADRLKLNDANTLEEKLHTLVVDDRRSLNNVANTLGISVQRVIAWAKKNNVEYDKRPRKTGVGFQNRLDKLLQEGASRNAIMEKLNISGRWITNYLAQHPDERDKWRSVKFDMEIRHRRDELLKILERYPSANQKIIQAIPKNPFQWLKRNDRDWLSENLPFFGQRFKNKAEKKT